MSSFFLIWIGFAVFFLIIEIITTTFYGLALAFSSLGVALYVGLTGETTPTIAQGVIFVILSAIGAYGFPKFFAKKVKETPQGPDVYLGKIVKVKKVGDDWKISLDGVDYLVDADGELRSGEKVKLISRSGSLFTGEIV